VDDPDCWCTTDGVSGGVTVPYSRCDDHFREGNVPWCFVRAGTGCKKAIPSVLIPGAAWKECLSSQCACTTDGMSGSINVSGFIGCQDRSDKGVRSFCYVAGGENCATIVTQDSDAPDAMSTSAFGKPAAGMAGAAYRSCAVEECQCTKTGVSGGVKIEAIGCADHFKEDKIPWCDGCRCLGLPLAAIHDLE
jgi:hypothetical protein